jgi:hypothetical protein
MSRKCSSYMAATMDYNNTTAFKKLFQTKFDQLTRNLPPQKKKLQHQYFMKKVKTIDDINAMERAFEAEAMSNQIAIENMITDQTEIERLNRYTSVRLLMGDALSDDEEKKKYYRLIAEIESCMKKNSKGRSLLSELALLIAENVYEATEAHCSL